MQEEQRDQRLAHALAAVANPVRLALLRELQEPRLLKEIRVESGGEQAGTRHPIARQTVKVHLDRLVATGFVSAREPAVEDGRATAEYVINHALLFALAEEFRELAKIRPASPPDQPTIVADRPLGRHEIIGPCLVVAKGLEEGRQVPLVPRRGRAPEWTIGRDPRCDLSLDYDPFVSGRNTRLVLVDGTYRVEDLPGTKNGTMLNFRRLGSGASEPLRTGDLIGVGRTLLTFRDQ